MLLRTIFSLNLNKFKSIPRSYFSHLSKSQKKLLFSEGIKRNFGKTPRTNPTKITFEKINIDSGPVPQQNLGKALIFSIAFSTGCFIGVSIWEYEKLRSKFFDKKHKSNFTWIKIKIDRGKHKSELLIKLEKWWKQLSPSEQVFVPICILNAIVFGLWKVPKLQPAMMKYFCSNPAAKVVCWPMILSTFSHISLFHIFANMFVLHSFSYTAVSSLGKEQFLGLYLSAGVISTLTSYLYKAVTFQSGFSLGASGAIMAIFAYVCVAYPDTRLSILFLPMLTFPAGSAIKVVMALDIAGCVLKKNFFDHAAHLGGALFGIYWYYSGSHTIWPLRQHFQQFWDEIRSSK